jgi:protocatechuate 3,4-dioxygenase alpha subunit
MSAKITPTQTIGPFPHEAWRWAFDATADVPTTGRTVVIGGAVYDGDGRPVDDALIEAWTPQAAALESGAPIPGFRRVAVGERGEFRLALSLAATPAPGEPVAWVLVFARGLLKHQATAVFLEDDPTLERSALLAQVPQQRRGTLLARKVEAGNYRWDIWLQTDKETVFFDFE